LFPQLLLCPHPTRRATFSCEKCCLSVHQGMTLARSHDVVLFPRCGWAHVYVCFSSCHTISTAGTQALCLGCLVASDSPSTPKPTTISSQSTAYCAWVTRLSLDHMLHQQTAVSTGLVDAMASPALLLSHFKHMVKAGTGFVSFSFSKTLLCKKKS